MLRLLSRSHKEKTGVAISVYNWTEADLDCASGKTDTRGERGQRP